MRKVAGADGGETSDSGFAYPATHRCDVHRQTLGLDPQFPSEEVQRIRAICPTDPAAIGDALARNDARSVPLQIVVARLRRRARRRSGSVSVEPGCQLFGGPELHLAVGLFLVEVHCSPVDKDREVHFAVGGERPVRSDTGSRRLLDAPSRSVPQDFVHLVPQLFVA